MPFNSVLYLKFVLSLTVLSNVLFNLLFLTTEFKPLAPPIVSSKDFLTKRNREDKPTETESSKAPILFSPTTSPQPKKVTPNSPADTFVSDIVAMPIAHGYEVDVHPTNFSPLLKDLLPQQTIDAHSSRKLESLIEESSGYTFHVSI